MKNYICPITNQQCDDECCTSAEHCNIDNKELKDDVHKLGNEDVPKLGYDVEKLAEEYAKNHGMMSYVFPNKYDGFIAGYNKAKETLYTEEQVREAMFKVYVECENRNNYFEVQDEIIQSLKQSKQ